MSGLHKWMINPNAPRGSELNPIRRDELDEKKLSNGTRSHMYTIDERGQVTKHYRSYSDYCD